MLIVALEDTIVIRAYEPIDKVGVFNLFKLNTPTYFSVEEEKDLVEYLENHVERYYILLHHDEIVGCGGINFNPEKTVAKISWDIIHPEYKKMGLGTMLLNYRINILKEINIKQIVVRTSQLVYLFYKKHGFELLEIKKNYWADGFDMYYMVYKN